MDGLRIVIVAVVGVLLARAARYAWVNRALAVKVWRSMRPRHVLGSLTLLALVVAVAWSLLVFVPVTRLGAGSLLGLTGNVVFAPVESALQAPGASAGAEPAAAGQRWLEIVGVTGFLAFLVLLFPHLAWVEEVRFRRGVQDDTLPQELWRALKFGLVHLIMLIPLAAALAVGVAGFVYGRVFRRAYGAAAQRRTVPVLTPSQVPGGPPAVVVHVDRDRAEADAAMAAAVWHATANTCVAVLVWLGYLASL